MENKLTTKAVLSNPAEEHSLNITCRCGHSEKFDIPKELVSESHIHFCKCGRIFGVKQDPSGQTVDTQGTRWLVLPAPSFVNQAVEETMGELFKGKLLN